MTHDNSARTYPAWIDEYAEAYRSSFMKHDVRVHMPFSGWDFFPLFADLYIDKVYGAVEAFRNQGLRVADVMDRLPNHASMKFKLSEIIYCMGVARTPPERVRLITDFFVEIIRAQTAGEPLWLNNRVRAFEDAKRVIGEVRPVPAERMHASEIGKIITGAATLGHGLFNDFCVDTSYDVYGPYDVSSVYGDGAKLLIRAFDDLNPRELWPAHAPFPFKRIDIFTVYKNVELTPTYVPCQMLSTGSLLENLRYFRVVVDGEAVGTPERLKEVRDRLLTVASELYVEFQQMGFEKQKALWLHQMPYQIKGIFDIVGQDWHPSQEMIDRVRGKELIPSVQSYDMPPDEFHKKFGVTYLKHCYSAM